MDSNEKKKALRLQKNEYFRNWRKNNPEKVQAINERFWEKKLRESQKLEKE